MTSPTDCAGETYKNFKKTFALSRMDIQNRSLLSKTQFEDGKTNTTTVSLGVAGGTGARALRSGIIPVPTPGRRRDPMEPDPFNPQPELNPKARGWHVAVAVISIPFCIFLAASFSSAMVYGRILGFSSTYPDGRALSESSTIGSVRTILSAQAAFRENQEFDADADGIADYGTLENLCCEPGRHPPYIDVSFKGGTRNGWRYTVVVQPSAGAEPAFEIIAVPEIWGEDGQRALYSDQTGIIRYETDNRTPTAASPAFVSR
jgi:hypothetical protein